MRAEAVPTEKGAEETSDRAEITPKRTQNIQSELMPGLDLVRITSYGNIEKPSPDIVLDVPHDGDHKDFMQALQKLHPTVQQLLAPEAVKYLDLERDIGSSQMAHQLAENLSESFSGLRIDVVEFLGPRGFVDVSRDKDHPQAVRPVIDFNTEVGQAIRETLVQIHTFGYDQTYQAITNIAPKGIYISMHSYDGWAIEPGAMPGSIPEYIAQVEEGRNQPEHRCFGTLAATAANSQEKDYRSIGDQLFENEIHYALIALGIRVEANNPYWLTIGNRVRTFLEGALKKQGLAFEAPKSYLRENPEDPFSVETNPDKIRQVVGALKKALAKRIKQKGLAA